MNSIGDRASILFSGISVLGNIGFNVAAAILHGIARIRNILVYAVKALRDATKSSTEISLDIAKAVEERGVIGIESIAETLLDSSNAILYLLKIHILRKVGARQSALGSGVIVAPSIITPAHKHEQEEYDNPPCAIVTKSIFVFATRCSDIG
jgi:hypothetical protein